MEQVPTKVQDFLDEDPVIRGQNYVCLSFLSPEDLLKSKEVFFAEKYVEKLCNDLNKVLNESKDVNPELHRIMTNLKEAYSHLFDASDVIADFQFFKRTNQHDLDKEFHEKNEYQTSIRGVKVRGVFDTLQEAKNRADFLKRNGDKFDIFVGQVGCWCPWSPNPEDIADSEYAETQLNTFMKKFKDNITAKDALFEQRKQDALKSNTSSVSVTNISDALSQPDPWMAQKEVFGDK